MHTNSLELMRRFRAEHVDPAMTTGRVLDVGSADVNGTYREVWDGWSYLGVDIEDADGVDRVIPADASWDLGERFDVALCGQVFEHSRRPWDLAATIGAHVRHGGLLCFIAPFQWKLHRHPLDCWRVAPDGMVELLRCAGCEVLLAELSPSAPDYEGIDCIGIGRRE